MIGLLSWMCLGLSDSFILDGGTVVTWMVCVCVHAAIDPLKGRDVNWVHLAIQV